MDTYLAGSPWQSVARWSGHSRIAPDPCGVKPSYVSAKLATVNKFATQDRNVNPGHVLECHASK